MKPRANISAFTLIELLVVIAIIGILAAMVAPSLQNFRKGDAIAAGSSQLLGGIARARQLAISQRTDVCMLFMPTNFWGAVNWNVLTPAERESVTNLMDRQLTGYTFLAFRAVGDQPGQGSARYLADWQRIPEGVFIPEQKFWLRAAPPAEKMTIVDPSKGGIIPVYGFTNVSVPFPRETSASKISLPCLIFDYQGRLVSRPPNADAEYIPLAQGSVLYPRDPETKRLLTGPADAEERPPGNSTNGYNLVRIDWLTGRGFLERREIQ